MNIDTKPTSRKGDGSGSKGVTGHRSQYGGVKFRTGIGCPDHPNCFTCPFPPDKCQYDQGKR
ncbi:MAG: hypothetical protein PHG35_03480 [Dehalococcoidales bacterium]|nr:hypothetical protein [Dehalococcoidales bacterium]